MERAGRQHNEEKRDQGFGPKGLLMRKLMTSTGPATWGNSLFRPSE